MKIAIVFYSMSGNTEYVANEISKKVDVDLIKIEPEKTYPDSGMKKFFWGGKSAIMGETPNLKSYDFNSNKYDLIIFGTPVWASNFTPPIRTFIKENKDDLKNKKIAIYSCSSGGGTNVIEKFKKCLEIDEVEAELSLIDPKDKTLDENEKKIEEFCKKLSK